MEETVNTNRKIYSLLEVTNSIKAVLSKTYSSSYWIKAEIAKLNFYPKSGHCYPDLVEKKDGEIKAQMRAIIWSNDYKFILNKFTTITGESLSEGINILFKANIEYSSLHGISLIINDVEPSFTLGEMAKEKLETIERLKKESIFNLNKSLKFPLIPKRIAVISVDTSKGWSDFLSILKNYNYNFSISLFPALLQGDKAIDSIICQLLEIKKQIMNFDSVSIIRGGGGDIGLNCYNNYELSRTIAEFPIPIITGIGHSTNETVAEMVAYSNKITPTDVAYFYIQNFDKINDYINTASDVLVSYALNTISSEKSRLNENLRYFKGAAKNILEKNKSTIINLNKNIGNIVKNIINNNKAILETKTKETYIYLKQYLKVKLTNLTQYDEKISLLNPLNILKRGYSITYIDNKIIKCINDVNNNDIIKTQFSDGIIESIVQLKKKKNGKKNQLH